MAMNWLNARYDARGRLEDVTKTLVEVDRLVAEILLQIQEIMEYTGLAGMQVICIDSMRM